MRLAFSAVFPFPKRSNATLLRGERSCHVAPFVPCHRIIHTDGTISAYGFGPELKVTLLEHEGALL